MKIRPLPGVGAQTPPLWLKAESSLGGAAEEGGGDLCEADSLLPSTQSLSSRALTHDYLKLQAVLFSSFSVHIFY